MEKMDLLKAMREMMADMKADRRVDKEETKAHLREMKTDRKVSRCATVPWRKSTIFRDIRIQGYGGPRQELGAAVIMVNLCARLARRKGTFARKDPIRDSVE
jgi:hypothetical protein